MRFNGKDFADFGVHVDESKAFGSPEKDYELVEIMGRNGNLSIYNDRFKDITLPFPCFIRTGFIEKYRSLLAYLNSQTGYQRLETDKEPNHFRKALFQGIVDPQTTAFNHGGFFTVNLLAHPQRFLKSGEIPVSASSQSVSYEGNPVEIDNPSGIPAVSSLAVALNPVQNLNGYDSPWVGGSGKNLLPPSTTQTSNGVKFTVNDDGTVTATRTASSTNNAEYDLTVPSSLYGKAVILNGCPSGGADSGTYRMFFLVNGSRQATDYGNGVTYTIPSSPTSCVVRINVFKDFNSTATFKPMIRLASVSDATYTPYENICPITGHTSASVTRTGKNLFNGQFAYHNASSYSPVFDGETYTVSSKSTGAHQINLQYITKTNTYYGDHKIVSEGDTFGETTVTIPTDVKGILIYVNGDASNSQHTAYDTQIELGSSATEYEPYQGQTYTINLNGTCYGGTVDLVTGVLTVDKGMFVVSGGMSENSNWSNTSTIAVSGNVLSPVADSSKINTAISSTLVNATTLGISTAVGGNSITSPCFGLNSTQSNAGYLYLRLPKATCGSTASAVNTWLSSNPITVVYPLYSPQTYQLTPQQISLLTGTNYISSDGNVTVTVTAPTTLENPTLFESKPLIRVYGSGLLAVNNQYITVATNPFPYIDIDCDMMDAFYGSNNANQYVSLPNDYITLHSGNNYVAYNGTVEITPRWFEI